MGNNIVKHDRAGCAGVSITSRSPSATLVVEAPDIATKNMFQEMESHLGTINLYDVVWEHGTNAGYIFGGTLFDTQINGITEVDLGGKLGFELALTPTADDPVNFVFT
jgi:hypothetical protein